MRSLDAHLAVCVLVWTLFSGTVDAAEKAERELITNVYLVAPDLFTSGWRATDNDPVPTPKAILQRIGLNFPNGAKVRFDKTTSQLTLTNTREEIAKFEIFIGAGPPDCWHPQLCVILERIEVERGFLEKWLLDHALDRDGTELRHALQKQVRTDQAEILDTAVILARSGQRGTSESVSERIYPTETDISFPGTVADPLAPIDPEREKPAVLSPAAYETRNVGLTLEVDPVIAADGDNRRSEPAAGCGWNCRLSADAKRRPYLRAFQSYPDLFQGRD